MGKKSGGDPYSEFLSSHRQLAASADAVLERIGEFGRLETKEDFQTALQSLNEAQAGQQKKAPGIYAAIGRQLRPPRLDQLAIRRLALVCRAAEVALGHTPWHHQIVCALLLNSGLIVEMPNGSGKTLAAALAAAFNSSSGDRTHIATSNDYLSERDARWMGSMYRLLGLSVGVLFSDQSVRFVHGILDSDGVTLRVREKQPERSTTHWKPPENSVSSERREEGPEYEPSLLEADWDGNGSEETHLLRHETIANYEVDQSIWLKEVLQCHIVYGRVEIFGLAYLQDNLKFHAESQEIQRRDMLIVDECDAVLIDDLRVPLLITQPVVWSQPYLNGSRYDLHHLAQLLMPGVDFFITGKAISLSYQGLEQIKRLTGADFFTSKSCGLAHGLVIALQALHTYHRDEDYIVADGRVQIIDRETGRLLTDRRYGDGLHEALEVKEGLYVNEEASEYTLKALITIKYFVRSYKLIAGMSGVIGNPEEYRHFYGLESISVQPYPPTRKDHPDLIYGTKHEARTATVEETVRISRRGQPVLINVPTLRDIDELSSLFRKEGIAFQALDVRVVRNMEEEAEYVRRAAEPGAITICSKLAARGTDIVISPEVEKAGGLYVIGLERGMDRRYDDQLRGRTGRHGNPGESVFILSLDDDLIRIFAGDRVKAIMQRLGLEGNVNVESPMVSRRIKAAQKNVERKHLQQRRQVVELDDILERHRMVFYDLRQKILTKGDLKEEFQTMVDNWAYFKGQTVLKSRLDRLSGSLSPVLGSLNPYFDIVETERLLQITNRKRQYHLLKETLRRKVEEKIEKLDKELGGEMYRIIILKVFDTHWERYLQFEKSMKDEISLYVHDFASASAKYAKDMEERFDSFFYEVGENALADILDLTIQTHAKSEETAIAPPAAITDSRKIMPSLAAESEAAAIEPEETNE